MNNYPSVRVSLVDETCCAYGEIMMHKDHHGGAEYNVSPKFSRKPRSHTVVRLSLRLTRLR